MNTTTALQVLLDQVDYTSGACAPNEMVGAVLDRGLLDMVKGVASSAPQFGEEPELPRLQITSREVKEICFCLVYADFFSHGSDGHNRMLLVAKLAMALGISLTDDVFVVDGDFDVVDSPSR